MVNIANYNVTRKHWIYLAIGTVIVVTAISIGVWYTVRRSNTSDNEDTFESDLLSWRDLSADPCQDFFQYSCGNMPVGNDNIYPSKEQILTRQQWKTFFNILDLFNSGGGNFAAFSKASNAYQYCHSSGQTDNLNFLRSELKKLGGWPLALGDSWKKGDGWYTFNDMIPFLAKIKNVNWNGGLFNMRILANRLDNKRYVPTFVPTSATVLNTELSDYQIKASIRVILRMFYPSPQIDEEGINQLIDLTRRIQKIAVPTSPNISAAYEVIPLREFNEMSGIDGVMYLNELYREVGVTFTEADEVAVLGKVYFEFLNGLILDFNPRTFVDFEMVAIFLGTAIELSDLPRATGYSDNIDWKNMSKKLPDISVPKRPVDYLPALVPVINQRELVCLNTVINWFAYAIANEYKRNFLKDFSLDNVKTMTKNIKKIFRDDLNNLDWIDETTRQAALQKIDKMKEHYIYPEWTEDTKKVDGYYEKFTIQSVHFQNVWTWNKYNLEKNLLLMKPGNEALFTWEDVQQTPLAVNAFYDPAKNSINILEGILQFPLYAETRLNIFNYAMISAILGHEISHGFDTTGSHFDQDGNMKEWMSESVLETFKKKYQCLIDQYSVYKLRLPDGTILKVNGTKTVGENIADLDGLKKSYRAYKKIASTGEKESIPTSMSDYSEDQLFFLSFAHMWCTSG